MCYHLCVPKRQVCLVHSLWSKWLPAKRKIVVEISKCMANAWLPTVVQKHLYIHYIQGESCGCVFLWGPDYINILQNWRSAHWSFPGPLLLRLFDLHMCLGWRLLDSPAPVDLVPLCFVIDATHLWSAGVIWACALTDPASKLVVVFFVMVSEWQGLIETKDFHWKKQTSIWKTSNHISLKCKLKMALRQCSGV